MKNHSQDKITKYCQTLNKSIWEDFENEVVKTARKSAQQILTQW